MADSSPAPSPDTWLTAADLGAPLGERATLVQFSTEFCTYCGPTRELLAEVARERDGVAFVEIDAASRMDLTRRLRVMSTPTVLVLDSSGVIERRTSGQPRKPDLLAAVGAVLGHGRPVEGDIGAAGEYHSLRVSQNSADADQAACCRLLQGVDGDVSAPGVCCCLTSGFSRGQAENIHISPVSGAQS